MKLNLKSVLKKIVDIVVFGRSKGWWSQPPGPPKFALDYALSGANGSNPPPYEEFTAWARLLQWFDGKKTYTGALLVALPVIFGGVAGFLDQTGIPATAFLKISGTVLMTVGILHKVVKIVDDLTPDAKP